jgi:hypothetical protein
MRTLHVRMRVSVLKRSLVFYAAVGYTVVGSVEGWGIAAGGPVSPSPQIHPITRIHPVG